MPTSDNTTWSVLSLGCLPLTAVPLNNQCYTKDTSLLTQSEQVGDHFVGHILCVLLPVCAVLG